MRIEQYTEIYMAYQFPMCTIVLPCSPMHNDTMCNRVAMFSSHSLTVMLMTLQVASGQRTV